MMKMPADLVRNLRKGLMQYLFFFVGRAPISITSDKPNLQVCGSNFRAPSSVRCRSSAPIPHGHRTTPQPTRSGDH